MNVHWTDTALQHVDAIYRYIAQDSPAYAKRVVEGPYRIIYYIKPDQIDVLAVLHGAQEVLRST